MTEQKQIWKCPVCGQVIEVLTPGGGELVCCGKPMQLQTANTTDAALEKHVPVIREDSGFTSVSIGSLPHPMSEEHFISWIELRLPCGKTIRTYLEPGDDPEVLFPIMFADGMHARAWCNLHGLWHK